MLPCLHPARNLATASSYVFVNFSPPRDLNHFNTGLHPLFTFLSLYKAPSSVTDAFNFRTLKFQLSLPKLRLRGYMTSSFPPKNIASSSAYFHRATASQVSVLT